MVVLTASVGNLSFGGVCDDFESRFSAQFNPVHQLPAPEVFTGCPKIYPTRQRMQPF